MTTIVIDIGCSDRWDDESTVKLIERYQPDVYYGFDPDPNGKEGSILGLRITIHFARKAAWTYDGTIGYQEAGHDGIRSFTGEGLGTEVECFDLASFVKGFTVPVILKIDAEGAEAVLVPHLIATGAIDNVERLLLEVHDGVELPSIPCYWEEW